MGGTFEPVPSSNTAAPIAASEAELCFPQCTPSGKGQGGEAGLSSDEDNLRTKRTLMKGANHEGFGSFVVTIPPFYEHSLGTLLTSRLTQHRAPYTLENPPLPRKDPTSPSPITRSYHQCSIIIVIRPSAVRVSVLFQKRIGQVKTYLESSRGCGGDTAVDVARSSRLAAESFARDTHARAVVFKNSLMDATGCVPDGW